MGTAAKKNLDVAIAGLAAGQHSVIDRRELRHLGASADAVRYRVAIRRLHRLHHGVYATVEPRMLRFEGHCLAAVKACGSGAVLSHRAAAALMDLAPVPSGAIDITVPRRGVRRRAGIALHVTRDLDEHEVTVVEGSRARASPARCSTTPRQPLRASSSEHWSRRRSCGSSTASHSTGRSTSERSKGAATIRVLLQSLTCEPAPTNRELERRCLELTRSAGLTEPVVNAYVEGHQVDFHWPAHRLVVETDGGETHDTPIAFYRDRARDLDLEAAGWHVIRLTWWQVTNEPERVVALVRARLAPDVEAHAGRQFRDR